MLEKMEKKEMEEVRSSLIRLKQLSDVYLKEEVSRNWGEITTGDYLFDRQERQASYLGVEPKLCKCSSLEYQPLFKLVCNPAEQLLKWLGLSECMKLLRTVESVFI
jgi:hypothetical protein